MSTAKLAISAAALWFCLAAVPSAGAAVAMSEEAGEELTELVDHRRHDGDRRWRQRDSHRPYGYWRPHRDHRHYYGYRRHHDYPRYSYPRYQYRRSYPYYGYPYGW